LFNENPVTSLKIQKQALPTAGSIKTQKYSPSITGHKNHKYVNGWKMFVPVNTNSKKVKTAKETIKVFYSPGDAQ
jgi:ABC-type phosphate transport system substrate-binding protein